MRKRVKALFEVVVLIVGLILSGIASGYAQGLQAKTFSALSAASTNCTLIYGMGPSLLQWVVVVNTTATTYYLKIYNKQTAPVAGTDTPVMRIPLPPQSTGGGGTSIGLGDTQFPLGLGFCVTAAIADNDSSNAATGVALNFGYVPQ